MPRTRRKIKPENQKAKNEKYDYLTRGIQLAVGTLQLADSSFLLAGTPFQLVKMNSPPHIHTLPLYTLVEWVSPRLRGFVINS